MDYPIYNSINIPIHVPTPRRPTDSFGVLTAHLKQSTPPIINSSRENSATENSSDSISGYSISAKHNVDRSDIFQLDELHYNDQLKEFKGVAYLGETKSVHEGLSDLGELQRVFAKKMTKSHSLEGLSIEKISKFPSMIRMPVYKPFQELGDSMENIPLCSFILPYVIAYSPPALVKQLMNLPLLIRRTNDADIANQLKNKNKDSDFEGGNYRFSLNNFKLSTLSQISDGVHQSPQIYSGLELDSMGRRRVGSDTMVFGDSIKTSGPFLNQQFYSNAITSTISQSNNFPPSAILKKRTPSPDICSRNPSSVNPSRTPSPNVTPGMIFNFPQTWRSLGILFTSKDPTWRPWDTKLLLLLDNFLLECLADGSSVIGYAQLSGALIRKCWFQPTNYRSSIVSTHDEDPRLGQSFHALSITCNTNTQMNGSPQVTFWLKTLHDEDLDSVLSALLIASQLQLDDVYEVVTGEDDDHGLLGRGRFNEVRLAKRRLQLDLFSVQNLQQIIQNDEIHQILLELKASSHPSYPSTGSMGIDTIPKSERDSFENDPLQSNGNRLNQKTIQKDTSSCYFSSDQDDNPLMIQSVDSDDPFIDPSPRTFSSHILQYSRSVSQSQEGDGSNHYLPAQLDRVHSNSEVSHTLYGSTQGGSEVDYQSDSMSVGVCLDTSSHIEKASTINQKDVEISQIQRKLTKMEALQSSKTSWMSLMHNKSKSESQPMDRSDKGQYVLHRAVGFRSETCLHEIRNTIDQAVLHYNESSITTKPTSLQEMRTDTNCALKLISKEIFWERVDLGKERADALVREVLSQLVLSSTARSYSHKTSPDIPIVQLLNVFETKAGFALELELMNSVDLFDYLSIIGTMQEVQAKQVTCQLLEAVILCNQWGIAHRDIKLSNVTFPLHESTVISTIERERTRGGDPSDSFYLDNYSTKLNKMQTDRQKNFSPFLKKHDSLDTTHRGSQNFGKQFSLNSALDSMESHSHLSQTDNFYQDEEFLHVKLTDFGMAGFICHDQKLRGRCGTLGYVAPDILNAGVNEGYSSNVDTFSIGVAVYTMLCGYLPFYADQDGDQQVLLRANRLAEYEFESPDWNNISDNAKDFIRKCLVPCGEDRLTPEEARNHPWIREYIMETEIKISHQFVEENKSQPVTSSSTRSKTVKMNTSTPTNTKNLCVIV